MTGGEDSACSREAAGRALPEGRRLDTLARADPDELKRLAEALLPSLGDVEILSSRTGLALLPCEESVTGAAFHLGEVLVAEAHVRLAASRTEGFGAIVGHDLERAMGMAVVDAAIASGQAPGAVYDFLAREEVKQALEDESRLRRVEATRVEMEAF